MLNIARVMLGEHNALIMPFSAHSIVS